MHHLCNELHQGSTEIFFKKPVCTGSFCVIKLGCTLKKTFVALHYFRRKSVQVQLTPSQATPTEQSTVTQSATPVTTFCCKTTNTRLLRIPRETGNICIYIKKKIQLGSG